MPTTRSLAEQFDQDGFVVVRGLLSPSEAQQYRMMLQRQSGLSDIDFNEAKARIRGWSMPDGVTKTRDWWPIIFHPRLVATIRETLGSDARYTQHSDLHVHHGSVGWHRDSANRIFGMGPDWDESRAPYRVARVAIYLQSYAESGSSFGVIPGSHRRQSNATRMELGIHDRLRHAAKHPDWLLPVLTARPFWMRTEPGDCVIFNQRLLHTGSHIRGPKYAIFLSYSPENEHGLRHRRYYLEDRAELGYKDFEPELRDRLRDAGLLLKSE